MMSFDQDGYFVEVEKTGKAKLYTSEARAYAVAESLAIRGHTVHVGAWDAECQEPFNSCTLSPARKGAR